MLRLKNMSDLARFAASVASLGRPIHVLSFKLEGRFVYGVLAVFHDYYKYYGVPVFYYVDSDKELEGNYILVKVEEREEKVSISKGIKPGWVSIPIIRLESPPPFLAE